MGPGKGGGEVGDCNVWLLLSVVYPTLSEALQQRWDQVEQDLADELITPQVGAHSGVSPCPCYQVLLLPLPPSGL